MILRVSAGAVGLILLGATSHTTIAATGGYSSSHAALTGAIALGVGVGALATGVCWGTKRRGLAVWLVVAILAGEAFGFISTAERLVVAREAAQAPLRAAGNAIVAARKRVEDADAAVNALPTSSSRLEAALKAKATADQAAVDKAAERGCRENCRQLLQAQVDATQHEIDSARAELDGTAASAKKGLVDARAALASLKAPESATPLADRLGVPAWLLDLVAAALGSMAANGLACGLIAFAGHHHRSGREPAIMVESSGRMQAQFADVQRFAFDCLHPGGRAGPDMLAIRDAFGHWCAERGLAPMPGPVLAQALGELFDRVGITLREKGGRLVALGVTIKPHSEPFALLPNPAN